MTGETFVELKQAGQDALVLKRGECRDLRVTQLNVPQRKTKNHPSRKDLNCTRFLIADHRTQKKLLKLLAT